jgi:hypothetical protein
MTQELIESSNIASLLRAEIDVQVSTARAFPRDIKKFLAEAETTVTLNEDIAASCIWSLPRKNKGKQEFLKGPSIRLAEILISCYGNFYAQTRILEVTAKTVTVEGVAWDLEKNVKITQQLTENINGTFSDAAKLAAAAASSKVLRNVSYRVIPKSYVDHIYSIASKYAVGDQKTLINRCKKLFERFQQMGIDQEKIFTFFNKKKIDEFTLEDVENLIGIGTAIKENALSIDAAFNIDEENASLSADERIKNLLQSKEKTEIDKGWDEFKEEKVK